MKKWISLFVFLCIISQAKGQKSQNDTSKIAAKIGKYVILKSEVEEYYKAAIFFKGKEQNESYKCDILKDRVLNKMLLVKAEMDSTYIKDDWLQAEIDQRLLLLMQQLGTNEEELEKRYGKTREELKKDTRKFVYEQILIREIRKKLVNNIDIKPKKVRKFFKKIPKDSLPLIEAEVEVGQIIKILEANAEQKNKTITTLKMLKSKVEKGEDFVALAKEYSEDYASASEGGGLGWHKPGNLIQEYETSIAGLKEGEISEPVESRFGFHLIQLLKRDGNKYNSRHILIRPKVSEEDIQNTHNYLDSLKNLILKGSMSFEEVAHKYSDDRKSARTGGMILNYQTEKSQIPVKELDTYFSLVTDTMKVGSISAPLEYKTVDGKTAMRIIYYKSQKPAHQLNLQDDYDRIQDMLKENEEAQLIQNVIKKFKKKVDIYIDKEYQDCKILQFK